MVPGDPADLKQLYRSRHYDFRKVVSRTVRKLPERWRRRPFVVQELNSAGVVLREYATLGVHIPAPVLNRAEAIAQTGEKSLAFW